MKKIARIAKKQEARWNRNARKQDKLLVWKKNIFRTRRTWYRTRADFGLAGITRRIQLDKACKMMQPVWDREVPPYDNSWEWRI